VFLNACRTRAALDQKDSWDLAEAFSQAKVPAVLGMQADVRGDAAVHYSGPLYQALANGKALDVALGEARSQVFLALGEDRRDWCLAHLSVGAAPDRDEPLLFPLPEDPLPDLGGIPQFQDIEVFINRREQRQALCYGVAPIYQSKRRRHLVVVTGEGKVGKSWLLLTALRVWKLWDWRLAYVNMDQEDTLDFLQTLRRIRDGYPHADSELDQRVVEDNYAGAFRMFNHQLNNLSKILEDQRIDDPAPGPVVDEKAEENPPWPCADMRRVPELIKLFGTALQKAAGKKPLIVALDNLRIRSDHFREYLLPDLIVPVAAGKLAPVHLILVRSAEEGTEYGLGGLEKSLEPVAVPPFNQSDFEVYARQFCRRLPVEKLKPDWPDKVKKLAGLLDEPYWKPIKFKAICEWVIKGEYQ
jgi:hypothetical protein